MWSMGHTSCFIPGANPDVASDAAPFGNHPRSILARLTYSARSGHRLRHVCPSRGRQLPLPRSTSGGLGQAIESSSGSTGCTLCQRAAQRGQTGLKGQLSALAAMYFSSLSSLLMYFIVVIGIKTELTKQKRFQAYRLRKSLFWVGFRSMWLARFACGSTLF